VKKKKRRMVHARVLMATSRNLYSTRSRERSGGTEKKKKEKKIEGWVIPTPERSGREEAEASNQV